MAKYFAGKTAVWVCDQALQMHGDYGYIDEYDIQRFYHDAKILEIYEGGHQGGGENGHRQAPDLNGKAAVVQLNEHLARHERPRRPLGAKKYAPEAGWVFFVLKNNLRLLC